MWSQRDPSLRKSGTGNIYVKNLDRSIDNKALYDTFSLFGNILSCKVASDPTGTSRGYGFVHYETEDAAKQAIERVNGMQIGEKTVEVTEFLKRGDRPEPNREFTNIYVKNVPEGFDEEKLKEMFGEFGTITSSAIMEDKTNRKFAFINFEAADAAKKAVDELNGKDLRTAEQKEKNEGDGEDELLYVGRAMSKQERAREMRAKSAPTTGGKGGAAAGVNLYVKNLDEESNDESLKELFAPFGTITSAIAMKDEKDKCKGFGFVCFSSPAEATKAVTEMHLKVVKGKPLYVGLAEKREARAERLRQRYSPATGKGGMGKDGGFKGGKGKDGGFGGFKGGKGGKDGMGQGMGGCMGGPQGCMGGPQNMMGGCGMNPMMGGGMMGGPQMNMMQKGMMCNPMMGMMGKGMPGGKPGMMGPMGMPPQMMGMMGKGMPGGGMPPQMMNMMGKGNPMMGMMRPMMPQMQPQQQQQGPGPVPQQAQPQGQPQGQTAGGPLTAAALAAAPAGVQKQMLGEKLYPAISKYQPELAGKITGMMLEMDNSELLMMLESEAQLNGKIQEAMRVLAPSA